MAAEPRIKGLLESASESVSQERSGFGSEVRARTNAPHCSATRRVSEYLRALGVSNARTVDAIAHELASETQTEDAELHAQHAVREAQRRFERWHEEVFAPFGAAPEPLWLRTFLGAHPEIFLADVELARATVQAFGDPCEGRMPLRAHFREQTLERAVIPRWLVGFLPPLLATLVVSLMLGVGLSQDGLSSLELLWLLTFSFLFGTTACGFMTALFGCFVPRKGTVTHAAVVAPLPRTALVMPIYHESAESVFAGLAAMRESLLTVTGSENFEIFVLSDSRDPAVATEEERAFRRVAAVAGVQIPIFYRRRTRNDRQKAGNLADFFERWGHRYRYAVVLDADSLMSGTTLVELVKRMEASPRLALLQAPVTLHGGETLFARALQFASSVYGPLHQRGLSAWAGPHGNYYGHNAVLRVSAFLESCALPELAGEPPFGGHILSHDFVEAALLCRAGWEVRAALDLEQSFEGMPPSFVEYVARDRRWCQGNLQHLRIATARGLKPMSRIHMLLGAAAYLAAPVWLGFLVLGVLLWHAQGPAFFQLLAPATLVTGLFLFGPRLLSVFETALDSKRRKLHGGVTRLLLGFGLELVFSFLMAPLLMLHHTGIVLQIVTGGTVGWRSQRRSAAGSLAEVARAEALPSLLGAAAAGSLFLYAPAHLAWLSPVWLPGLLAVPLTWIASLPSSGALARKLGLLSVPSETAPAQVTERAEELRVLTRGDDAAQFRDLVLDPVLLEAHLTRLGQAAVPLAVDANELCKRALKLGPAGLTSTERKQLTTNAGSMRRLHREAWQCWPVESWEIARERPQLPSEPLHAVPLHLNPTRTGGGGS